ncbi:MAG TPA: ribonuclease R, partial [Steroidobacteraceae bacterium]|nr:ribonuclease R [Steroidobacteraceae bacterium]
MPRKIKNKQRSATKRVRRKDRSAAPRNAKPEQLLERISAALRDAGLPLTFDALAERMQSTGTAARQDLNKTLEKMLQAGEIVQNRRAEYCLRERLPLIVGVVSAHKDGHGMLLPDDRSAPIFLSPRQMLEVIHGDRVAVRISGKDHKGRPEGSIVKVLERGTEQIVGRLYDEEGICFLVPDNPRIGHRVLIPRDRMNGAQSGQVVLVKIVEQPSRTAQPLGHVTRVLGEHLAPGMETDIAIHSHGLPFEFPSGAIEEAEAFGDSVAAGAKRDREDVRELSLVTIDGEDARDFDDAVYCEPIRGGWKLIVAIADVGHYVARDSALDREAQDRGTSVYFPNRVLPMLPEALSNGLCSLNPLVDRLCLACEMRVNEEGKVTRARFFEGVMRSHARLTYTKVAAYLANPLATHEPEVLLVGPMLKELHELFRALHRARLRRGALDFDAPELKVHFDAHGKIAALVETTRNDAHRLIEECMIAANVQAAKFLKKHRIPTLFRVHGQPEEDRLEQLHQFLQGFGISLPRDRELEPKDLAAVLQRVNGIEEGHLVETVVVRSMPQAVYQPENIGHFGLALTEYAHFTSPIRRYPDLMVHRGIRHVLQGGDAESFIWSHAAMMVLGQRCSFTERRADDATRDALSWLKCEYMRDKLGEEFDTVVTSVVDFGLFVRVKGMQIDGLVHVSALGADYFTRDRSGFRMVAARSGRVFKLGDHLR